MSRVHRERDMHLLDAMVYSKPQETTPDILATFGLSRIPLNNITIRSCSRSVEALKSKTNRKKFRKPVYTFDENRNQMLNRIKCGNRNEQQIRKTELRFSAVCVLH